MKPRLTGSDRVRLRQYNLPVSGSDNDELRYAYAGIKHDRFGAFSYGRQGRSVHRWR